MVDRLLDELCSRGLTLLHRLNDGWCDNIWDGRPRSVPNLKQRESQLVLNRTHQ